MNPRSDDTAELNGRRGFLWNSLSISSARGAEMAVAVACGILIARYLGAQDFGKYAFVVALVSFFGCFVDMGLDNIIIRETAKGREGDFFGAALLIRSAASVFTLALLGVAVEILDLSPEITKAAWLAFVTLVVAKQVGLGIFRAMAIGKERAHFDTFLTVPFQLARLGAVLWVIQTGRSFVDFFVTFLVVDTLHAIVALEFTRSFLAEFTFTGIKRVSSYLLRETSLLALITVFNTSYLYLDTFLLKALKSDVEVGLFNAPYKLINIMALLILSFLSAVFPLLARSASKSGDAGTSEVKSYLKLAFGFVVPVSLVICLFADRIILIVFGPEFAGSVLALRIMAWVLTFRALGYICGMALVSEGRQKALLLASLLFFASNIIVDLILIPGYGQTGAAMGTVSADIVFFLAQWLLWLRRDSYLRVGSKRESLALVAGETGSLK